MAHDEKRSRGRQLSLDDGHDVGYDERGWAGEAFLRVFVNRPSPASLIEAMYFNPASSEVWKKFVVAIAMVTKAMDEDDFGYRLTVGLQSN
jgi:hypothetical protein